ncbi:MAG: hypothetical protein ACE5KV_03265, partial [Thermoplasmata archaeon]
FIAQNTQGILPSHTSLKSKSYPPDLSAYVFVWQLREDLQKKLNGFLLNEQIKVSRPQSGWERRW